MTSPKTKCRSRVPIRVNGMQRTPSRRSETAKFSRNKFVMVLILWFFTCGQKDLINSAAKNIQLGAGLSSLSLLLRVRLPN
jgi:hypothetical protein